MGTFRANAVTHDEKGQLTDVELEHLDDPPYKLLLSGKLPDAFALTQGASYQVTVGLTEVEG